MDSLERLLEEFSERALNAHEEMMSYARRHENMTLEDMQEYCRNKGVAEAYSDAVRYIAMMRLELHTKYDVKTF